MSPIIYKFFFMTWAAGMGTFAGTQIWVCWMLGRIDLVIKYVVVLALCMIVFILWACCNSHKMHQDKWKNWKHK